MTAQRSLRPGDDAFPVHAFEAFGARHRVLDRKIGGSVIVLEKHPEGGPVTLMTAGASRLPTATGERVELAVEVADGQQTAGMIALQHACNEIATRRSVPPLEVPWITGEPLLPGTAITTILASASRWGAPLDEVCDESGLLLGHVRTLRLLTAAEAQLVREQGWAATVERSGGIDRLLDVTREAPSTAAERSTTMDP